MPAVRAFIAIKLPISAIQAIDELQARLAQRRESGSARWTRPANIHLTLKFLGDVPSNRLAEIERAMVAASQARRAFNLNLAGLGCFPNSRKPRIVWLGLTEDTDQLLRLQQDLECRLEELGWAQESRPFRPHLTIARVRNESLPAEISALGQLVEDTHIGTIACLRADSIHLLRSDLRPSGPVYTELAQAPLPNQQPSS